MAFTLAQQMARTIGVFQGLLALPILLWTASLAFQPLAYPDKYIYYFT
jgi:hypothetical protein